MKTIRVLLLMAIGWLALPTLVWAFYNPSVGRWLSRDPIGEHGFEITRKGVFDLTAAGFNHYCFVLNDPLIRWDMLGTECGNPCELAKAMGWDKGEAGGVICCGGQKYACIWRPPPYLEPKVQEIALRCALLHEALHFMDVECNPCNLWPDRPPWKDPADAKRNECNTYKAQLACLNKAKQNNECGGDPICQQILELEIGLIERKRDEKCK